jgi:3-oxoacyl-[acyl-carrier-protein] synthase-1
MGTFVKEENMSQAYILGDNIITSLGFSTQEVIYQVKSGISGFQKYDNPSLTPTPLPLSLINSDLLLMKFKEILSQRHPEMQEQHFSRLEKMFIVSIHDAIKEVESAIFGSKSLLLISTTKGNIDLLGIEKNENMNPGRVFLWEMADFIGSFFGFVNRPMVVSNACISGVLSLSSASRLINSGKYDHVVVSGGDILSEFVISGFLSFQALSNEPCKPFDIERNGLSLGEGCGTIVVSSENKKSNAISIAGSSITNDANHISGPSRTGEELAMAIQQALEESHLKPEDINFVSAHGTATLYNDEMESKAIEISGLQHAPVNSFKGYWGHTLGAAGIIESVATIQSMKSDLLFRSAGFHTIGVPVLINVLKENIQTPVRNCLKIASGFGGCNAAIVFQKM